MPRYRAGQVRLAHQPRQDRMFLTADGGLAPQHRRKAGSRLVLLHHGLHFVHGPGACPQAASRLGTAKQPPEPRSVENRDEVFNGRRATCLARGEGGPQRRDFVPCLWGNPPCPEPQTPGEVGDRPAVLRRADIAAISPPTASLLRATSPARQEIQGPTCHSRAADRTYTNGRTAIGAVPVIPTRCPMDKLLLTTVEATLLTVEQAAERLGTSVRFIRRLRTERRLTVVKLGKHIRIDSTDLEAHIHASRQEACGAQARPVGSDG